MIAFIIGNGKSREGFDLEALRGEGLIIGCNSIYQDFIPDVIVSFDPDLSDDILQAGS